MGKNGIELKRWNPFQERKKSTRWKNYDVLPQCRTINRETQYCSIHKAARKGDINVMTSLLEGFHKNIESVPFKPYQQKLLFQNINLKDQNGWTALHYATQKNYIEICELLYKYSKLHIYTGFCSWVTEEEMQDSQLDLCTETNGGVTPFHFAAQGYKLSEKERNIDLENVGFTEKVIHIALNHQDCLSKLLKWIAGKKKIAQMKDKNKMTPLHWACQSNNVLAAIKLLEYEARKHKYKKNCSSKNILLSDFTTKDHNSLVNDVDINHMTPLHHCAMHHSNDMARLLLELGANLTLQNKHEETALHCAVLEGNVALCHLMIEFTKKRHGIAAVKHLLETVDISCNTPLHIAARRGCTTIIDMLIQHGNETLISQQNSHGDTALHLAAISGRLNIVEKLSLSQAHNKCNNYSLRTPLHAAAKCNHLEVVKYFVQQGAHIDGQDNEKMTAVQLAAYHGNIKTLRYLLSENCDVMLDDIEDKTCLHLAAEANRIEAVKIILSVESSDSLINKKDHNGNTPLLLSALHGYPDIMKCLLANEKCDVAIKNESGKTAIHIASKHGHTQILKILLAKNPMQIHAKDDKGNTPLILASMVGEADAVMCLVKYGANLEACNCNHHTALTTCAIRDFSKTAKILIQAGAKLNSSKLGTITPLHVACINGSSKIVQLLLQFDVDVTLLDSNGNRALDLAIKHGHRNCAKIFVSCPKWRAALRSVKCMNGASGEISTPLRQMIKAMPKVAEVVLNRCTKISPNLSPEDEEYNVEFDFEFLDDIYTSTYWKSSLGGETVLMSKHLSCFQQDYRLDETAKPYCEDNKVLRNNHPLAIMADKSNTSLLFHPLVNTLLQYKWMKYGRIVYYTLLLIYITFVFSLTIYLVSLPPPYAVTIRGNGIDACFVVKEETAQIWRYLNCDCCQYGPDKNVFGSIFTIIILILSTFNLCKEAFQLWQSKLAYFKEMDNYLELLSYLFAIIVVINWDVTSRVTGIKQVWQWQLAAICLLTSWVNLALFVRKLPTLGIYVIMILDITKTFSKFFVSFLLYIIGFALFFYMLLQNQEIFHTWWQSLIKVSVMMVGELDYGDIFFTGDENGCMKNSTDCYSKTAVFYPGITYTFFVLFLIMMPVIIMNLLVGLAVDDIKLIQEHAAKQKMAMQIKLALDVEFMLPEILRKHLCVGKYTIYPNKYIKRNWLIRFLFEGGNSKIDYIARSLSSIKETRELLLDQYEETQKHHKKIATKLGDLLTKSKEMNDTIALLAKELKMEENDNL